MDLLDSYIQTLRIFLPRDQRDDIIRELTEEIRSQVADKEAELGRPLTTAEQTAVIGQYGHPMLMAARYRPQQHLVGPLVFPYYWLVLRVVIGLVVLGHAIAAAVLGASGASWVEIGQVGEHLVRTVLAIGGWFTLLAAVIDRSLVRSRILEKWDPKRMLPCVMHTADVVRHVERVAARHGATMRSGQRPQPSQSSSVSGLVIAVVLSVWWLLSLKFPVLMLGGGAAILTWGPVVDRVFPFLVVVQVVALAEHFVRVVWPDHRRLFQATRGLWLMAFPVFVYFLLSTDNQWVVWRVAPDAHSKFDHLLVLAGRTLSLVDVVNGIVSLVLLLIALVGIIKLVNAITRLVSGKGISVLYGVSIAMIAAILRHTS